MKKPINKQMFDKIKLLQGAGLNSKMAQKVTKLSYNTVKKAFIVNTHEEYLEFTKTQNKEYRMKKLGLEKIEEAKKVINSKVFDEVNTTVTQLKAIEFNQGLVLGRLDKIIQLLSTKEKKGWF